MVMHTLRRIGSYWPVSSNLKLDLLIPRQASQPLYGRRIAFKGALTYWIEEVVTNALKSLNLIPKLRNIEADAHYSGSPPRSAETTSARMRASLTASARVVQASSANEGQPSGTIRTASSMST